MIGIVIALKSEAQAILNALNDKKPVKLIDKTAFVGKLGTHEVIVAVSGIGKVNAATTAQAIIDRFAPYTIVNVGTAGGVDQSVSAKNYYGIKNCCQFDFDLRDLDGVPLGYIQDYDTQFFPCSDFDFSFLEKRSLGTADRFTESEADNNAIKELGCSIRDMEGAAIAHTCHANSVPLIMIKGITDVTGSNSTAEQFRANLEKVCAGFPEVVLKALNEYNK